MMYRFFQFMAAGIIVIGMLILSTVTNHPLVKTIAVFTGIIGIVFLSILYFSLLKRLSKHDKEFFQNFF